MAKKTGKRKTAKNPALKASGAKKIRKVAKKAPVKRAGAVADLSSIEIPKKMANELSTKAEALGYTPQVFAQKILKSHLSI